MLLMSHNPNCSRYNNPVVWSFTAEEKEEYTNMDLSYVYHKHRDFQQGLESGGRGDTHEVYS